MLEEKKLEKKKKIVTVCTTFAALERATVGKGIRMVNLDGRNKYFHSIELSIVIHCIW